MEGHWKFLGEEGLKVVDAKYEAKLEFFLGGGGTKQKPSMGGEGSMDIF